jgi:SAM-dependent methyltransferase
MELDQDYWSKRYHEGKTGWDIGYVSTPIREYVDQLTDKNIDVLIPGCGMGLEGQYFLNKGFHHTFLLDISSVAFAELKKKEVDIPDQNLIVGDIFELEGKYDLIVEQTLFCALDPSLRRQYIEKIYDLLKPNAKFVGVLFDVPLEGGPPFGGDIKEYKDLFQLFFRKFTIDKCYNSIEPRKGRECFFIAQK